MMTFAVCFLMVIALVGIVGGVAMMIDNRGSFMSWYFGYTALCAGFEMVGKFGPLFIELVGELFSSVTSNN